MADPLSPIASVVGLISAAVGLVQQVRKARDHVKGARMTRERVSSVLNNVTEDLDIVKSNSVLQIPAVEGRIKETKNILESLASLFSNLEAKQQRGSITKILIALKTGDTDAEALKTILSDLQSASSRLHMQISVLTSNLVEQTLIMTRQVNGRAEISILEMEEANTSVQNGFRNVLERMENSNNEAQLTGPRMTIYNTSDMVVEEVDDASEAGNVSNGIRGEPSQVRADNLTWRNNQACKSRIVAGNVGVEDNSKVSSVNSTVVSSKFNESRYVGGHVGGSAAKDFWKD